MLILYPSIKSYVLCYKLKISNQHAKGNGHLIIYNEDTREIFKSIKKITILSLPPFSRFNKGGVGWIKKN